MRSITVFMYHHILPQKGHITLSVKNFEEQMSFLYEKKYKTITLDEFYKFKTQQLKLPRKSVLITFDDGWRDTFYYAYPILKKYNLKATIFVITEWVEKASINKSQYKTLNHNQCSDRLLQDPASVICSWDELINMQDVFRIHSHTHTHREGLFTKPNWRENLEKSKNIIERKLGIKEKHLCWPKGYYDNKVLKQAKDCGYKMFYTTHRGVNLPDNKLCEIKRIAAKKGAP